MKNGPEGYILIDKGFISNYLRLNIKNNYDGTFGLSQSQLIDKITNHVGLTVSASLKQKENLVKKLLIHKDSIGLAIKGSYNYRDVFCMLSYIWGFTRPDIFMTVHQCAPFINNPRLWHKCSVGRIAEYLDSTYMCMNFLDGNISLSTSGA